MAATSGCAGENLAAISDLHGSADYTFAMEKGMGDVERDRRMTWKRPSTAGQSATPPAYLTILQAVARPQQPMGADPARSF